MPVVDCTSELTQLLDSIGELIKAVRGSKYAGGVRALVMPTNALAKELLPTEFKELGPPAKLSDFPEHLNLVEISRVESRQTKAEILRQLRRWKLKVKEVMKQGSTRQPKAEFQSVQGKKMTLDDLENPITCTVVAGIVREKSHNVAAKLRRRDYPVVISARKSHCEVRHAMIVWHHKKGTFKKYLQDEEK